MATTTLPNIEATESFAQRIAEHILPGDVIELWGEVGAGKTAFTSAFARALGVREPVRSPTYTIAHSYELPSGSELVHLDCYRENGVIDAGSWGDLEPYFTAKNIACVEWPEPIKPWISDRRAWVLKFEAVSFDARVLMIHPPKDVSVVQLLA